MKRLLLAMLLAYCANCSALVLVDKDGRRYVTTVKCKTHACAVRQADYNAKHYGAIIATPQDSVRMVVSPPEGFSGDAYVWRMQHEAERSRTAKPIPER